MQIYAVFEDFFTPSEDLRVKTAGRQRRTSSSCCYIHILFFTIFFLNHPTNGEQPLKNSIVCNLVSKPGCVKSWWISALHMWKNSPTRWTEVIRSSPVSTPALYFPSTSQRARPQSRIRMILSDTSCHFRDGCLETSHVKVNAATRSKSVVCVSPSHIAPLSPLVMVAP